jgi:steroid 5-alpha reductase family enzyme
MMNVWLWNAIIIEGMAVLGTLGVWVTRRTKVAFVLGFNTMLGVTGVYIGAFRPWNARHLIMLAMVLVYLGHMNWLLWFHSEHTALSKLDARLSPYEKYLLPFLLTNVVGWGYCLPFYFGAQRTSPLGLTDGVAVAVYVLGTFIHFGSDYQKQRFKARAGDKGTLLVTGFWALCRHPNYFGDFLIYMAFALIGGSAWGWIAPALNFMQYRFDAIPKSERWAAERYGEQWEAYRQRVKMFIPYVY